MEWEKTESLREVIERLKIEKFEIIGVEQDKRSINYREINQRVASRGHLALVFGNEVDGLSKEDIELCDEVVEIPMKGAMVRQAHHPRNLKRGKESLNVAVTVGIVLYSLS